MYPISMYVLLEAQSSMLQWQVLRSGITSWVRVHASASRLIIMQLRTIVALRAVQRGTAQHAPDTAARSSGESLPLHIDCG